jgi:hypothetical protein
MSLQLLQTVQENLGYPALQKVDSNTKQIIEDANTPDEDKFSQAAIPAVLTGLYRYAQTDEGANEILLSDGDEQWTAKIFDEHKKEAIQVISSYAKQSSYDPLAKMNAIAAEAAKLIREQVGKEGTIKNVKEYFSSQKNDILLYLLPTLNMGDLLNDNTLDDDTNKMEGPISSLMHSLGNAFTTPTTNEELEKKANDL